MTLFSNKTVLLNMQKILLPKLFLLATLLAAFNALGAAPALVDARWLAENKGDPKLVILDIQAPELFIRHHLPGAINMPFALWRTDGKSSMPGMLRPVAEYEKFLGNAGITNDQHLLVTSTGLQAGDLSATARVFWTLKLLGHENVSVLNGGLADYARLRLGSLMRGSAEPRDKVTYQAKPDMSLLAKAEDLGNASSLVDARSPEEYLGLMRGGEDERPGTVAGSHNLPFSWLTKDASSGTLLDNAAIDALFNKAGIGNSDGAVHFCHTGNRAALTWFADYAIRGNRNARLYDASMLEWASDPQRDLEVKWAL